MTSNNDHGPDIRRHQNDWTNEGHMPALPISGSSNFSLEPTSPLSFGRNNNDHSHKSAPKSIAVENEDLGEAPIEREAGLQIFKAWQDLERKERKAAKKTASERESDDEELFATLEDDDDAIVLSRLTKKKHTEGEESDEEEKEEDEGEAGLSQNLFNGNGAVPPSPTRQTAAKEPKKPTKKTQIIDNATAKVSSRSGKSLPKKKKKKTHRRAESVEAAMFGLDTKGNLDTTTHKRKRDIMSSKVQPRQDSPLQATEQLIQTAQAHVQNEARRKRQLAKRQHGRGHAMRDNDDIGSDEEREQELNEIINEDGDKSVTSTAADEDGHSILNRIEEGDSEEEDENEESKHGVDEEAGKKKRRRRLRHRHSSKVYTGAQQDWELFQQFWTPRKASFLLYLKVVCFFLVLPCLAIAALVFYLKELPEQQEKEQANQAIHEDENPYISWWMLFLGVRQIITLTMALLTQAWLIDYIALGSRISIKYLGPAVTLLAVQAKGWPCILFFWAFYDLVLLSGDRPLAHHWGYWQSYIDLFNESNHSGKIVQSDWNFRILITALVVGAVVAVKRVVVGLFLAKKTLSNFGAEFEDVKRDMILIGELATLAMEIQIDQRGTLHSNHSVSSMNMKTIKNTLTTYSERSKTSEHHSGATNAADAANAFVAQWKSGVASNNGAPGHVIAFDKGDADLDSLTFVAEEDDNDWEAAEQAEIDELLNEWEGAEDRLERKQAKKITLGSILKFYKEVTVMNRKYPFLPVFGRADSRDKCIISAQRLYDRLMLRTPSARKLPFSTLALLAKDDNTGRMNRGKLRELIRVFRPDRDGKLSKLDFVKCIDAVFRNLRMLSLNIEDSAQIDKAVEVLVNVVFYCILGSIVLHVMGVNPFQVFVSLSSLIIGFAFMFAASSARWFEGVLFILVQRPYGVGDRVHFSNPASETSANGSSGWIVEKVTLNTTTVYWGATNERATLSNGAIAKLRVINAARSPKATIYVHMKFGIDTHYKKIQVFRSAAEQFLKRRPREWAAFIGFRPSEVVLDRGYIAYTLIAQHRESWQKIGAILGSKANLTTYLLEVSKQLGMRYVSPPLPVDLKIEDATTALKAAGIKRADMEREKDKGSVGTFF